MDRKLLHNQDIASKNIGIIFENLKILKTMFELVILSCCIHYLVYGYSFDLLGGANGSYTNLITV